MSYKYEQKYTANCEVGGMTNIDKIIIHHWGAKGQKFDNVVSWFLNPHSEVSAHYVVESGRVCQMVKLSNKAWHCYQHNVNSVGIECRPEMTDGDLETAAEVVARVWKEVGKKLPLKGHKDFNNTSCPGSYYAKLNDIKIRAEKYYDGKPIKVELEVDGILGVLSVKALQKWLGTVQDGWITGQIEALEEYTPSLYAVKYDNEDGSMCVEALQNLLITQGFSVGKDGADGQLGKNTVKALQKYLIKQGFSVGKEGADGYLGTNTAKALQKFLNDNAK